MFKLPKIGDIVIWQELLKDGEKTSTYWPAIVYDVKDKAKGLVSLTIFRNGIPYRIEVVAYNWEPKPGTWRWPPEDY
jgi:hypothetical protein